MPSKRILKNLIDLATGTFVSRILGFLRELVTAAFYGTGKGMDLFVIAFTIPTFFRRFLGEDVVERAFMPPFKSLLSQGKHASAWRLLSACLNAMVFALIAFMTICYLIAPLLVRAIAPGIEEQFYDQAVIMTYWILPFMLIIGLASFAGGILNFFEMNRIYSIAPAFMSIGVVIGIYFFKPFLGIYALAAGFLLGGLLELIVQVPFLYVRKIRKETKATYYAKVDVREKEFRTVGRESGFILLKSLLDKSVEIVGRILASFLVAGSIASLWFSQRLIQLPAAIIGLAISRSLIPYLTERKALTSEDDFIDGIRLGIRMNFALIIPVTVMIVVLTKPIIALVYQRGSFDAESTALTSIAFLCYALGLLGLSLNAFFSRIFSVFQKNKLPFYVSIITSIVNIILNFVLVKTPLKHGGIALASSIGFTLNSLILFYWLLIELGGRLSTRRVLAEFAAVCAYSTVAGIAADYLYRYVLIVHVPSWTSSFYVQQIIYLALVGAVIGILFVACVRVFGPTDLKRHLRRRWR
ncbi:MAG: murein biosynthesis integral membrane protein MurJ [candidate division KSB1 bacterium]|jgi:putative peptidoglycan lipid II flippase|nr:murein biosynthesis integral membrane protein MurJ [candidate division KSB1 bacterium]